MMKSIVAAAAIAAGMMTFAAGAQERAENPKILAQSAAKKTAKNETRKAAPDADACPYLFGCGSAKKAAEKAGEPNVGKMQTASIAAKKTAEKADEPNVDKMKTASIAPRVSPKLNAKARKKVIRKDVKAVDIRKDDKAEVIRKDVKAEEMPAATASTSGVQYGSIVARYAESYGVPASLAHAVIRIESNYRVNALGRAGEIGLMQIKPATARMMGYSGSAQGLYNPETNIKFGIKYLSMAHKLGGGTTCGTILKYNAGHAAKRMNPISARYCSKVKQHLAGA
ncbi:Transglycosylase SLT domain-containing protein [Mesorhizobium albiziae]|uniref:Transglycosylase SLT domain-containing protein n=1 Tax=Neomesorhizobium albiziae TaxID=335020 RepID=A0A1I3VFC1_9HYPH|nr:lytic transglycosylase [Mesorhizobium albiziae]SFJ93955.1 Transglycosylase SLT domain-containing protein [Mesorhizobium albiziae]